jgi:HSP20 family protein
MLWRRRTDWPASGWTNPFGELEHLRRQMDWMNRGLSRGLFGQPSTGVFPLMNVTEDKDNYYIRAELPGIKAKELDISVTGDTLSISGERKLPAEDKDARYHRKEREGGSFNRIVNLPAQINADKVEANCTDGVLKITLPKAEVSKPKQITVKAS